MASQQSAGPAASAEASGSAGSEGGSGNVVPVPEPAADPSRVWLPELVQRISTFLPRNAIPCILRRVDRVTAAQFSARKHRTIHLSEPVPHGVFAARWSPPGAARNLPLELRHQLVSLTAASGVVENMAVAMAAAGCLVQPNLLGHAAAAGQVQMCAWLHVNGCPACKLDDELDVLALAAARGRKEVCEWLLANRYGWSWDALCAAAGGGHFGLMLWLWRQGPGAAALAAVSVSSPAGTAALQEGGAAASSISTAMTNTTTAAAAVSEWGAAAQAVMGGIPVDLQLLQEVAGGCDVATLRAAHAVWQAADQRAREERREEVRRQQQQRRERRSEQLRLVRERYGPHYPDQLGVGDPENPSDEDAAGDEAREVAGAAELTFDERKQRERVLGAAAGSPTRCWREKVAFLEEVGFAKCAAACEWAAAVEGTCSHQRRPPMVQGVPPPVPEAGGSTTAPGSADGAGPAINTGGVAGSGAAAASGTETGAAGAAAMMLFDLEEHSDSSELEPEAEEEEVDRKGAEGASACGDDDDDDDAATTAAQEDAGPDDALTRLRWLRRRGYPADGGAVIEAAQHGNTAALAFLLHRCGATPRWEAADAAAEGGHVGCLRLLRRARATMGQHTLSRAAQRGRLRVVRWLVEQGGLGVLLDADDDSIMSAAAGSGCVPLLAFLRGGRRPAGWHDPTRDTTPCPCGCGGVGGFRSCSSRVSGAPTQGPGEEVEEEHGPASDTHWMCPWDEDTFAWAADGGCEEVMEWMKAHGCPMGRDGLPYVWAAINGDLAALACLRRLDCRWAADGGTFVRALRSHRRGRWCSVPALQWLLDAGCPVGDWEVALKAVRVRGRDYPEVVKWLEQARKEREAEEGAGGAESEEASPKTAMPGAGCVPCCLKGR